MSAFNCSKGLNLSMVVLPVLPVSFVLPVLPVLPVPPVLVQVMMDDGTVQLCSRNIACIYYLTKDWTAADGGQLVDLEAPEEPQQYLPSFNSLIAFSIPRWHEVKPVLGDRPRYSVGGVGQQIESTGGCAVEVHTWPQPMGFLEVVVKVCPVHSFLH